ncbi:MAG: NAD(P)-dependent glycerol-1-phosphate dehydrogenase [Candidatus Bathyarchaeia archaeon]
MSANLRAPHYMQLPREVVVGDGSIREIAPMCDRLGLGREVLIVSGPKTYGLIGELISDLLVERGYSVRHAIVESAEASEVERIKALMGREGIRLVLGVGGGKSIDVAKLSSAGCGAHLISVPTAASHDGIASPYASIKGSERPYSIRAQAPIGIVADTEIIGKSPFRLLASGCGDSIAKYTAVRDWRLAHEVKGEYYGEYAANLALMSSKLVMERATSIARRDPDAIRTVVEALISCGVAMSIAGNTRPCSGSEHLFAHALELVAKDPGLHGERCGLGTIMMAKLHGLNWRRIRAVLERIGCPTTASQLGVREEEVVEALSMAHKIRPERFTILGERGLSREEARRLAEETGVI